MFADFIVREKHCYFAETIRLIREATGDRLFDTAGPRKKLWNACLQGIHGGWRGFGMHVCTRNSGYTCSVIPHSMGLENRLFDTVGPRKNFGMHMCKEFRIPLVRSFPIPWGLEGIGRD